MPPWSQGRSESPAREGEAGSRKRSEESVGMGKAKLFPLRGARRGIHVFDALSLIYSISCHQGFGDAFPNEFTFTLFISEHPYYNRMLTKSGRHQR